MESHLMKNDEQLVLSKSDEEREQLKGQISDSIMTGTTEGQGAKGLLHAALQAEDHKITTLPATQPRGECLTKPNTPYANKGLDNIEGNLIVHKNDLIRIPNQKIIRHKTRADKSNLSLGNQLGMTGFEILGLLGQGTFAQVFKCRNKTTGELCALKIVKNKPEYTRQVEIEIQVFKALAKDPLGQFNRLTSEDSTVSLLCYFVHESHPCLVFELLGLNLFELLKRRQFRGLPLKIVRELVKETMDGMRELSQRKIVHCDLKPENILLVSEAVAESLINDIDNKKSLPSPGQDDTKNGANGKKIKLIDFGSACFEGRIAYTYTQSRYYRSPEVLVGIDYDSAIDMWSLGCVAVELFLGLPILPGVHEHDQLSRICAMIGSPPDWILEKGKNTAKYFSKAPRKIDITKNILLEKSTQKGRRKIFHQTINEVSDDRSSQVDESDVKHEQRIKWEIKSREKFIKSLTEKEREKERARGLEELEQRPSYQYIKTNNIEKVVLDRGSRSNCDEDTLRVFIHFLNGLLNPDPCERWTAFQASSHPFITGKKIPTRINTTCIHWSPPFDPAVGLRKLSLKMNLKSEPNNVMPFSEQAPDLYASSAGDMSSNSGWVGTEALNHGRYSPPASIGVGVPPQNLDVPVHYMSGSIGSIPYQSQGGAASQYTHPSSLSHLHNQGDPGDMPFSQIPMTPQSFNVIYYDGMNHVSNRGDLGLALQRPGIHPDGPVMNHVQQSSMNPEYYHHSQQHFAGPSFNLGQYPASQNVAMGHFSPTYLSMPMSSHPDHSTHHYGSSMPTAGVQYQNQLSQGIQYSYQSQDMGELTLQDEHEENNTASARPGWSYYRGTSM